MTKEKLAEQTAKIEAGIAAYNKALAENDFDLMRKCELALTDDEAEYAQMCKKLLYEEFLASDTPVKTAVSTREYIVLGHKAERESGELVGFVLADKVKFVDLGDFVKRFTKSTPAWKNDIAKLGYLITLRIADDIGTAAERLAAIKKNYTMSELARKVELGETPTSNTKTCKMLQSILDKIIFEDAGDGKNKYKCNNKDVQYLEHAFAKLGRRAGSLAMPNEKTIERMVYDIAWRVVTNGVYDVTGGMIKDA